MMDLRQQLALSLVALAHEVQDRFGTADFKKFSAV